MIEPSQGDQNEKELRELEGRINSLRNQINDKQFLLLAKPTIRWSYLFRKLWHIARFEGKKLRHLPTHVLSVEEQLKHRTHCLKHDLKILSARCLRLEAEIIEDPIFSWERLVLHLSRLMEYPSNWVFRVWVKNYRYRLGKLYQYDPRPMRSPLRTKDVQAPQIWPTIQIIIPSYQQAIYLERTLKSVVDQNYPSLKVRVFDGGSLDGSVDIIRRFETRLAGWVSQKDNGQTDAIRQGFAHPDGEIMAYLNSDDIMLPGTLERVGAYFATHPDVDVVYGHRVVIDAQDQEVGRWFLPPHQPEILRWADYIPQETMFWRRSIYEKAGGMDVSFRFAMDWDLILRFDAAGARFVRLPYFLAAFRVHAAQKTCDIMSSVGSQEMQLIRRRIHQREVSDVEIAHRLRGYLVRSALLARRWEFLGSV